MYFPIHVRREKRKKGPMSYHVRDVKVAFTFLVILKSLWTLRVWLLPVFN